jgi:type IV pilus assembly protein PilW
MIRARPGSRLSGFSMVELMVAMAIALIGMIIIFQVFETSEGIKRTTTSGGDAQQNGIIALYNIEADLRNAGMGFNETGYTECRVAGTVLAYDSARTTPDWATVANPLLLVPVMITAGANAQTPDQLKIFYGSATQVMSAAILAGDMANATSQVLLQSNYGFREGDIVIALQPGSGKNCALMEVTAPSNGGNPALLHDTTNYNLAWMAGTPVKSPRFNKAGGMGVVYTGANTSNATRIFNLGNLYDASGTVPVLNTYSVSGGNLVVQNEFNIVPPGNPGAGLPVSNPIADNVVHLRAQYGLDDGIDNGSVTYHTNFVANDGIVDRFVSTTPANWQQVVSIRVAVLARSALPEKPSSGAGGVCDATPAAPTWSGAAEAAGRGFDLSATVVAPDDWRCYRYRLFESTIPLRNWIWRAS